MLGQPLTQELLTRIIERQERETPGNGNGNGHGIPVGAVLDMAHTENNGHDSLDDNFERY